MTETQWLTCSYPDVLLDFVSNRVPPRKLRLFGVACCRRIWHLLPDEQSRAAVLLAERSAEGLAGERELEETSVTLEPLTETEIHGPRRSAYLAAYRCTHRTAYHAALWSAYWSAKLEIPAPRPLQAELLRHIAGNPFRRAERPPRLPSDVVLLAEALYECEDCAFALQDALREAEEEVLADHFESEAWHPRGCWALDLILGKA